MLEPNIKAAKYVRILPKTWHKTVRLNFELLGCVADGTYLKKTHTCDILAIYKLRNVEPIV